VWRIISAVVRDVAGPQSVHLTIERADGTRPTLLETARDLFTEYQRDIGVDLCFQGFADELRTLPGAYAPPRGCLLIASRTDLGPVGCVAVRPLAHDVAEMKRLYVRPAARGQGVGRRLAEEAIAAARSMGYGRMRLDTLDTMTPAITLYRVLGFTPIAPYTPTPLPGPLYFERPLG
jgi:ribosomal protein S18 acetylase RimI-like enzyme